MSDIQIIRSPSGDELVVIPRAEYDALVAAANVYAEDQHDIAIYDARKADERHRMTLEGSADIDAGHVIDQATVESWAKSLETDTPGPVPISR